MLEAINTFAVFMNLCSTPDFLKVEQNLKRLFFMIENVKRKPMNFKNKEDYVRWRLRLYQWAEIEGLSIKDAPTVADHA